MFVAVCLHSKTLPAICGDHLKKSNKPHEAVVYSDFRTGVVRHNKQKKF